MLWSSYCMLHGMYTLPPPCSSCPSVHCLPRWLSYLLLQHMSRDKILQILPTRLNILQILCRIKLILFSWRHNVWSNRTTLGVSLQLWIWPNPQPGHCPQSHGPLPYWAKLWHAGELTWQRCSGHWAEHHFGGNIPSTNWSNGECWKVCCNRQDVCIYYRPHSSQLQHPSTKCVWTGHYWWVVCVVTWSQRAVKEFSQYLTSRLKFCCLA